MSNGTWYCRPSVSWPFFRIESGMPCRSGRSDVSQGWIRPALYQSGQYAMHGWMTS